MASSASGQDDPNRAMWLATQVGKIEPSSPLGTTRCIPQEKFPRKPYNKSFIDQVCSVKMAGYWPRSFFASLWTSTSSRSINTQKKNLANIQPSWTHTWSITHTYCILKCSFCKTAETYFNSMSLAFTLWRVGEGLRWHGWPRTIRWLNHSHLFAKKVEILANELCLDIITRHVTFNFRKPLTVKSPLVTANDWVTVFPRDLGIPLLST